MHQSVAVVDDEARLQRFAVPPPRRAWSPSISAPIPALVRCTLSMKSSPRCSARERQRQARHRASGRSRRRACDESLGLGGRDEGHVVAEARRERGRLGGRRARCGQCRRQGPRGPPGLPGSRRGRIGLEPPRESGRPPLLLRVLLDGRPASPRGRPSRRAPDIGWPRRDHDGQAGHRSSGRPR